MVATVLTACGIETRIYWIYRLECLLLQQYLPLAVLKLPIIFLHSIIAFLWLQQYLPLAVLKREFIGYTDWSVSCCNSTYRLRYWNVPLFLLVNWFSKLLQQYLPLAVLKLPRTIHLFSKAWYVATVLTTYSMYQLNSINPRVNHFGLLGGFVS